MGVKVPILQTFIPRLGSEGVRGFLSDAGNDFILGLSKGNLDLAPPKSNQFVGSFKQLHSDLRGPIGNTGSLIKMILDGDIADPDEVQRTLRMVYTSSESTYVLLENLLAWSDSRRKEIPYNPGLHLVGPIFNDTMELYRSALEVKASTTAVRYGTNNEKCHGLGLTLCFEMV